MQTICLIFSSGFGLGYLPKAPGTFGTLWGVLLYFLFRNQIATWHYWEWAIILLAWTLFAVLVSHFAEKKLGTHDSSIIVIDEVVGFLVTIAGIPYSLGTMIAAFLLFRMFDILKPPPIKQIDRHLPGAWGVVLDDVVAGIFANLLLRLLLLSNLIF